LIVRDVDVLVEASLRAPVSVTFSVPTVDDDVCTWEGVPAAVG
jgi:DNA repair photolyase